LGEGGSRRLFRDIPNGDRLEKDQGGWERFAVQGDHSLHELRRMFLAPVDFAGYPR
jgi:hypothetical protein